MLHPIIEIAEDEPGSADAVFADLLRETARGSSMPGRTAAWFASQLRAFYRRVRDAALGGGPASARDRNLFIREALAAPVVETDWPGLPLTRFMAGAYFDHTEASADRPLQTENWTTERNVIAAWFFFRFASQYGRDRWITPRQQRALAAPAPGALGVTVADALARTLGDGALSRAHPDWPPYLAGAGAASGPTARPACWSAARPISAGHALEPEDRVWFGSRGGCEELFARSTWFPPEIDQRWTRNGFGLMSLPVSERAAAVPLRLDVDLVIPQQQDDRPRWLAVVIGDRTVYETRDAVDDVQHLRIPLGQVLDGGRSYAVSVHSSVYCPADHDSPDERRLGVALRQLSLRELV